MMFPDGGRIVSSLGGRWQRNQGMCRCPAHEDRTPSLHVTDLRDTVLVHCFAGCDQRAVIDALRDLGLWPEREENGNPSAPAAPVRPLRREPDEGDKRRTEIARTLWQTAQPASGTIVEDYLRYRGITRNLPPTLRFAESLRHTVEPKSWPAMIAAIQDGTGRVCAVQRTWLRHDGRGKAPVMPAKAGLGPMHDGAVRLGRAGRVLGIAEGIETGLSAMQIYSLPVWACLGTGRMHTLTLPPDVEHVVLFADTGEAGRRATERAAQVYRARVAVDIETPDEEGADFNDVLRAMRGAA